jgi:exosome complex component RRP45
MPREVEPSLNERQFIRDALFESIRLDGRQLDQYRNLDLQFGDDYGVADVRLGKTRCVPTSHKTEDKHPTDLHIEW